MMLLLALGLWLAAITVVYFTTEPGSLARSLSFVALIGGPLLYGGLQSVSR